MQNTLTSNIRPIMRHYSHLRMRYATCSKHGRYWQLTTGGMLRVTVLHLACGPRH